MTTKETPDVIGLAKVTSRHLGSDRVATCALTGLPPLSRMTIALVLLRCFHLGMVTMLPLYKWCNGGAEVTGDKASKRRYCQVFFPRFFFYSGHIFRVQVEEKPFKLFQHYVRFVLYVLYSLRYRL